MVLATANRKAIVMTLEWPWLDLQAPAQNKRVMGFDISASSDGDFLPGQSPVSVQASVFLYTSERDPTQKSDIVTFTLNDADTAPGSIMPIQAQSPSVGPSITLQTVSSGPYPSIEFESMNLYIMRGNEYG